MLSVLIPIGVLIIAILSVAALWLWWSGEAPPELAGDRGSDTTFPDSISEPVAEVISIPTPTQTTYTSTPVSDEVLRVVRASDGRLHVLINGTTYRNMADVSLDPSVQEHLINTLRSLSEFAQQASGITLASTPGTTAEVHPAVAAAAVPVTTAAGMAEIVEANDDSVAGQIERFLQARLARTPDMTGRSIHISSTPNGGVQIKVDSTLYESVGDVAEPDAREIIESAIRDWEASLSV
jgi:hypothetical protein